ncbi:MAG TPA: FAD-binding oxidoreductase [Gaiellaceae bacterium]|nr:FAD-binding oxidoreductase [Gaiellaceae bacterium]
MAFPERATVVIVGGGVMGASTAFHLAEAGVPDVVLVERDALASGSTSRAAGGVRAQFSDELNIAIALRSLEAFDRFRERPGAEIDLHKVGYLFLLDRAEDVRVFERSVALQNEHGVPSRLIDPAEAKRLSPLASLDGVLAATFCPIDGHASPEAVVQGYGSAARAHGAEIVTGCAVTGIEVDDGEIRAVETTRGRIETSTVVCTAGVWSREVARMVGIDLPVEPYLREVGFTGPMPGVERPPMTIDFSTSFYFHGEGQGLLFGMADPAQPPGFDTPRDPEWLEKVLEVAERRCPALADAGIAGGWAGYYEASPDHNALIGESPEVTRFLYATGFSGHGFLQGPAVGEIVADLVRGREPFVDVGPLAVERFATAELRPEHNVV